MKNNFEDIFKDKNRNFDFEEPNIGHFERFQAKLEAQNKPKSKIILWPWISIAASVILMFGVWFGNSMNNSKGSELADVSPQMEETQDFFVSTIKKEIAQIEKSKTPENQKIIDDAFVQLEVLENNYKILTLELKESNEDKRVIFAMISNFQQRITVLQNLMDQLESIENFNAQNNQLNNA